jgi:hypothetical protein
VVFAEPEQPVIAMSGGGNNRNLVPRTCRVLAGQTGSRSRFGFQLSGDAGDEALEEAGEAVLDLAAGFKDFLVTELG